VFLEDISDCLGQHWIIDNIDKVFSNLNSILSLSNVDLVNECGEFFWPASLKVLIVRIDLL
jgi:hypothetical protein